MALFKSRCLPRRLLSIAAFALLGLVLALEAAPPDV